MAAGGEPMSLALNTPMPASFSSIEYDQLERIGHLGSGGFGLVYLCRHRQWGKVAVKQVIDKHVTEHMREEFRREVRNLWHVITSPHVVSVMGMTEEVPNEGIFIIMEYLEYGNLKNFAPKYMVTKDPDNPNVSRSDCWARRIRMICDVILGMNFCHTAKPSITHRDLKLENIFVGSGFKVKIGDFGLSVSSLSRSAPCQKVSMGTTTHLPPEILSGTNLTATEAFDIYSFGITLFEFVALTLDNKDLVPYPHWANDTLIAHWVVNNNIRPNDELILEDTPELVMTTMKECWNGDYTKRPSFQDLKDKFITFYEDKYESSIASADTLILQEISLQKNARSTSGPTGWTPPNSPKCHPIHNGSTPHQPIKSKQPVQTTVSKADDDDRVDSISGAINQPSQSTTASSDKSSTGVPPINGQSTLLSSEEPSTIHNITPLTSSDFNPSTCEVPQGKYPYTAAPPSTSRLNAAAEELSPRKADVTGCHQAASNSGSSSQPMQPASATYRDDSISRSHKYDQTSVPEGQIPGRSHSRNIDPLSSTEKMETIPSSQQQLQRQQGKDAVQGGGTARFPNSSSRPQQVTGQDYAGCTVTPGNEARHGVNGYQATGATGQVEDLQKPFQNIHIADPGHNHQPQEMKGSHHAQVTYNQGVYERLYVDLSKQDPAAVTSVPIQEESHPHATSRRVLVTSESHGKLPSYSDTSLPAAIVPRRGLSVPVNHSRSKSASPNLPRKQSEDPVIKDRHIRKIEGHVGMKYRQLGRGLGLTDVDIETLHFEHSMYGTKEVVHQMLMKWIGRKGSRATKSVLVRALKSAELAPLCSKI